MVPYLVSWLVFMAESRRVLPRDVGPNTKRRVIAPSNGERWTLSFCAGPPVFSTVLPILPLDLNLDPNPILDPDLGPDPNPNPKGNPKTPKPNPNLTPNVDSKPDRNWKLGSPGPDPRALVAVPLGR